MPPKILQQFLNARLVFGDVPPYHEASAEAVRQYFGTNHHIWGHDPDELDRGNDAHFAGGTAGCYPALILWTFRMKTRAHRRKSFAEGLQNLQYPRSR